MIQTEEIQKIAKNDLLNRLAAVYQIFNENGDHDNGRKLLQLLRKLHDSEFMIGFSGHFSAGKSSMINELIGENLLPSSPIPTSANLVKVKSGREYARVYYKNGKITEFPAPYDYEVIKYYCKDGESVESIEISHHTTEIPRNVTIMDTPGIDSTDDAHRVSTESALHLADVLFYVMDYNHVLSELNFQFTKELTDRNKTLYLIVNQIDKHDETELSFSSFQKGVEEAFANWNVSFSAIYYTTIKNKLQQNNDLQKVKDLLLQKIKQKDELIVEGVYHSANQLILDHIAFLDEKNSDQVDSNREILHSSSFREAENINEMIANVKKQVDSIMEEENDIKESYSNGIDTIISNVILMPFQTRELAKEYLEAEQPDFKVGLLFSKGKTDKEREARREKFYQDVKEKASTQLEWHVRDFVSNELKNLNLSMLLPRIEELNVGLTQKDLQDLIKPGARVTGEYVLTYTEDVSRYMKKRVKQQAMDILEDILKHVRDKVKIQEKELTQEMNQLLEYKNANESLKRLNEKRKSDRTLLQDIIIGKGKTLEGQQVEMLLAKNESEIEISSTDRIVQARDGGKSKEDASIGNTSTVNYQKEQVDADESARKAITDLENAQFLLKEITGLSSVARDMGEKALRLKNRHFTVALFGAFSAGKSSFANALMGDEVLPVSPNPTTATINKISFPTEKYQHGTVLVKIKSVEQLLQDLNHSLQIFDEKADTLEAALSIIKARIQNKTTIDAKEKPHYTFLRAVITGFQHVSKDLGNELTIDLTGFKEFVANEEKACFVEWIELFYNCPLTEQGITLVDTPGADSINARHTGVAFEYIKNADAILFVTYYNHAFSKADREFLIQLGRVKDTFSMDKMFFLINAADLANSKDELQDVKGYVEAQLVNYGIRFPRLYAVSSRAALLEKLKKNAETAKGILESSGIEGFEGDFHSFIVDELTQVAINEGYADIQRAATILRSYIESAKEGFEGKQAKRKKAQDDQNQIRIQIQNASVETSVRMLEQEIKELIYYIKQRVFLRVPDLFKEAFNPSSLKDDGRDLKKALQSSLTEFLYSVGFDLSQEFRATTLRIEKLISKMLADQNNHMNEHCMLIDSNINISKPFPIEFEKIEFENGLENDDTSRYKKALAIFKNPKSFFEKNEKKLMLEEVEKMLQTPTDAYLSENQTMMEETYSRQLRAAFKTLQEKALLEVDEYYEGIYKILSENIDTAEFEEILEKLQTWYMDWSG